MDVTFLLKYVDEFVRMVLSCFSIMVFTQQNWNQVLYDGWWFPVDCRNSFNTVTVKLLKSACLTLICDSAHWYRHLNSAKLNFFMNFWSLLLQWTLHADEVGYVWGVWTNVAGTFILPYGGRKASDRNERVFYNCSNVVVKWICVLGSVSVTASFHGSSVLVENFVLSNPPPSASISRRIQSNFCSYICGNCNEAWNEMRRCEIGPVGSSVH